MYHKTLNLLYVEIVMIIFWKYHFVICLYLMFISVNRLKCVPEWLLKFSAYFVAISVAIATKIFKFIPNVYALVITPINH